MGSPVPYILRHLRSAQNTSDIFGHYSASLRVFVFLFTLCMIEKKCFSNQILQQKVYVFHNKSNLPYMMIKNYFAYIYMYNSLWIHKSLMFDKDDIVKKFIHNNRFTVYHNQINHVRLSKLISIENFYFYIFKKKILISFLPTHVAFPIFIHVKYIIDI